MQTYFRKLPFFVKGWSTPCVRAQGAGERPLYRSYSSRPLECELSERASVATYFPVGSAVVVVHLLQSVQQEWRGLTGSMRVQPTLCFSESFGLCSTRLRLVFGGTFAKLQFC